jgi:hypothetical protein
MYSTGLPYFRVKKCHIEYIPSKLLPNTEKPFRSSVKLFWFNENFFQLMLYVNSFQKCQVFVLWLCLEILYKFFTRII